MKIELPFDIGDKVKIIEIKTEARITEIRIDGKNVYYRCQYWINGEPKSYELYEEEIKYG